MNWTSSIVIALLAGLSLDLAADPGVPTDAKEESNRTAPVHAPDVAGGQDQATSGVQSQLLSARARRFHRIIEKAAERYGVDAALLHAVIAVESEYNPRAVSPKGARGLMQLMPLLCRRYGVTDPYDPRQNIRAGARHLAVLLKRFKNDLSLTLAAYNAGEPAVTERNNTVPPYPETLVYIPKVLDHYQRLRAENVAAQ